MDIAEGWALIRDIEVAQQMGFSDFSVELDSLRLINVMRDEVTDLFEVGFLMAEVRRLLQGISMGEFSFYTTTRE